MKGDLSSITRFFQFDIDAFVPYSIIVTIFLTTILLASVIDIFQIESAEGQLTNTSSVSELTDKGNSLYHMSKYEEAITWFDKALDIDPQNFQTLYNKAILLGNLDRHQDAISSYDKALEIDPKSVDALFGKGTSLYDLGKYEEAIIWYDKALAIDPKSVNALINKGGAFYRLGMNDDALTWLDKAFDIDPEWLEKALEKDPNNEELLELESLIQG